MSLNWPFSGSSCLAGVSHALRRDTTQHSHFEGFSDIENILLILEFVKLQGKIWYKQKLKSKCVRQLPSRTIYILCQNPLTYRNFQTFSWISSHNPIPNPLVFSTKPLRSMSGHWIPLNAMAASSHPWPSFEGKWTDLQQARSSGWHVLSLTSLLRTTHTLERWVNNGPRKFKKISQTTMI